MKEMKNILLSIEYYIGFNILGSSKYFKQLREMYSRPGFINQHTPQSIEKALEGMFSFSSVHNGNPKKGQGDIVIVNLKQDQDFINIYDYLSYTRDIERIEKNGIYTNIFFGKNYYKRANDLVLNKRHSLLFK